MGTWWRVVLIVALASCRVSSPAHSTISLDRAQSSVDYWDPVVATVTARDAQGAPVSGVKAMLVVDGDGVNISPAEALTDDTGTAVFHLRSNRSGDKRITAYLDGDPLGDRPFVSFAAGPLHRIMLSLTEPLTTTVGETLPPIEVTLRDSEGNVVTQPTDLTLGCTGNVPFTGPHTITAVGGVVTFEGVVFFTSATTTLTVSVSWGVSSPGLSLSVQPGPPVSVDVGLTPYTTEVYTNTKTPLLVAAHDQYGNLAALGPFTLSSDVASDQIDSSYADYITFLASAPGRRTVTLQAGALSNRLTFEVLSAPPIQLFSNFYGMTTTSFVADGLDTATVSLRVSRVNGPDLAHELITLTATGPVQIFPTARTTTFEGIATFTVRSTTPGAVTLTANLGSRPLVTSPVLTFTPPTYHLVTYVEGLTSGPLGLTSASHGDVTISPGAERASFPMPLAAPGQQYSVRVKTQPPGQVCRVFGGDGVATASNAFVGVRCGARWKAVVDGLDFSAAIRSDGTLWAWGSVVGQPWGSPSFPVPLDGATDWQQVATDGFTVLALRSDGSLWATGVGVPMQPVGTDTDWASLAGGIELHALKTSGALWSFSPPPSLTATLVGAAGDSWRSVSGGSEGSSTQLPFTAAVKADGTLWVWGSNTLGVLGLGTFGDVAAPTQLGTDADWALVSAGTNHALAMKTDGSLWAWGTDPLLPASAPPHRIGLAIDWAALAANKTSKLLYPTRDVLLKADGTMWTFDGTGLPTQYGLERDWAVIDQSSALKRDGSRWTMLFPSHYAWTYPVGRLPPGPSVLPSPQGFVSIAAGGKQSSAIAIDGSMVTWGEGLAWAPTPTTPARSWHSVAALGAITAGIAPDGTAMTTSSFGNFTDTAPGTWVSVVFGAAAYGLRNDATLWSLSPLVELLPGSHWTMIDGSGGPVGIMEDGTRWSWSDAAPTPQQLSPIAAWLNASGTEAVWADRTLWSQGFQVGVDHDWTRVVSGGGTRTFALKTNGSLWAFGDNQTGAIDSALPQPVTAPTRIGTGTDWVSIAAGELHTLGLRADGSLWVWGNDGFGQLGDGLMLDDYRFAP